MAYIVTSGKTSDGVILNNNIIMKVLDGGTALHTTVNYGGALHVSRGGMANSTTVNSLGFLYISEGGTANSTTINNEGFFFISNGGTADNTIMRNGSFTVDSGGTADNTIMSGGSLIISSGGTANNIVWTPCIGRVRVSNGGVATFASEYSGIYYGSNDKLLSQTMTMDGMEVDSNGQLYVMFGGTANRTTINSYADFNVYNGGTANDTVMNGGWGYIYSGGTANGTNIYAFSHLFIYSGGTANNTTVTDHDARVEVYSGGTANSTTVNISGSLLVFSGGTANGAEVNFSGNLFLSNGGMADGTTVNSSGNLTVSSGGTANNTTINSSGSLSVVNGGKANSAKVNSGGKLFVSNGGTATEIVENGGFVSIGTGADVSFASHVFSGEILFTTATVHSGTTANSTRISGGNLQVFSGGIANSAEVNSNGSLNIFSGGKANSAEVNSGGMLFVANSGTADSTTVNYGGNFSIYDGGTGNSITVNSGGSFSVDNGGTATEIIENGGFVHIETGADVSFASHTISGLTLFTSATVHSGTTAGNIRISSGNLQVHSGGIANETIIYGSGRLTIFSGGIADSVKTYAGGNLRISSGGILTGKMSFLAGAVFSVEEGAVVNFDLTQTSAGEKALLSDWSLVQGTPTYTITVNGNMESGTYTLANSADDFDGTITVQNTDGESLGTLSIGQTTAIGDTDYMLAVTDGSLTVTVGSIAPAVPDAPAGLRAFVDGQDVALVWNVSEEDSGVKEYIVRYSFNGQTFTESTRGTNYVLNNADYGTWSWSVQAVDFAGNESAITVGDAFTVSDFKPYIVEYSTDNFEHVLRVTVSSPALDSFRLPTGTYQSRSRAMNSADWTPAEQPIVSSVDKSPALVQSDADGNADLFFANASGIWESGYAAKHTGALGGWSGTGETVLLSGKNQLADIFEGSTDTNILLMTDDQTGDALFVDDIYTALPGTIIEQQARIARIDEIRAGAGNDIVDMTSQRFEYIGDGLTIRGGDGDDVIWANKGDNRLFGDAGNDRIVGASGNDVIAGGIGNDSLHGGGGNDVFTFCDNWGVDTVEQLESGTVTLWFASSDESNWNAETLTYTDGENSVTVSGVSAEKITLRFGNDGSAQFAALSNAGAFDDFTSQRIFEESDSGILASL